MTGIIDTSSLVAVARYYLSIKDETKLLYFLESKFRSGDLILLETIRREASYTHQGLTLSLMDFLNDSKLIVSDSGLLPPLLLKNSATNWTIISALRSKRNG